MPAQPGDPGPPAAPRSRVARAVRERLINAGARHVDKFGQVAAQRGIHLAHVHQAGRNRPAVQISHLVKKVEPGEMDPLQVSGVERWLGQALPAGIGEPLTKWHQPIGSNLRPYGDTNLIWHQISP